MKQLKAILWTAAAICAAAGAAWAGDWHRVGDFTTGGGAKEIGANYQNVRRVEIQCLDGGVNVQTLWVRNGGQKQEFRVAHSFTKGEKYTIELGGRDITGFRISDSGNGRYRIHVLTDGHHKDEGWGWGDGGPDRRGGYDDRYDRDRRGPPPPPRDRGDRGGWGGWFPGW